MWSTCETPARRLRFAEATETGVRVITGTKPFAAAVLGAAVVGMVAMTGPAAAAPDGGGVRRAGSGVASACAYRATVLPTLPGRSGRISGTDRGTRFAGSSTAADGRAHATIWQDGVLTDLGVGGASDVNRSGHAVGTFQNAGNDPVSVLWRDGATTPLANLPKDSGISSSVSVRGINDSGDIVGIGFVFSQATTPVGVLWHSSTPAVVRNLGPVAGGLVEATDEGRFVGNQGIDSLQRGTSGTAGGGFALLAGGIDTTQVTTVVSAAGRFTLGSGQLPGNDLTWVLWENGVARRVTGFSSAHDVNVNGLVVGRAGDSRVSEAVVWDNGVRTVLPGLGGRSASAEAVTDDARIGGWALDAAGRLQPVVWSCS